MLANILPLPSQAHFIHRPSQPSFKAVVSTREPPPYGHRINWKPRAPADFGDGGAFPEIPLAQYPLNMGKTKDKKEGNVTSLQVDAQGNVRYDAVITQNARDGQKVYTNPTDLIAKDDENENSLIRPSEKTIQDTTEATRLALEKLVDAKITAARPRQAAQKTDSAHPVYIRYTPGQQGTAFNSGAKSRIIRLHEMPVDPLEPPKFRHKKVPTGPPSPPVPVMHSPPRKVTVQDQLNWKIPPCISNWKNIKGYTIPLDKRIAADGRGLQERTINDSFAHLSEALYVSERQARHEVDQRALARRRVSEKIKKQRGAELKDVAADMRHRKPDSIQSRAAESYENTETKEQVEARLAREELRHNRKRERTRQLRQEENAKKRKGAADRNKNRTGDERIALGISGPSRPTGEALYDQRLFNQSQGMDSGFGADDDYTAYDKPLFKGSSSSMIYKPSAVDGDTYGAGDSLKLLDTDKRKANKEFQGTDESRRARKGGSRKKPIAFEKDKDEMDPFNLNSVKSDALDTTSKHRSTTHASGSVASKSRDGYSEESPQKAREELQKSRGHDREDNQSRNSRRDRDRSDSPKSRDQREARREKRKTDSSASGRRKRDRDDHNDDRRDRRARRTHDTSRSPERDRHRSRRRER